MKKHREHEREEQAANAAEQAPPAAPPPAAGAGDDTVARLTELKGLLDSGVLTQDEFDAEKAKVLGT